MQLAQVEKKLNEVRAKLESKFKLTDLGEPNYFLGIITQRDFENQTMRLSQVNYISKLLKRFGFENLEPKRTPMITSQVANRELKMREQPDDEQNLQQTLTKTNAPYKEAVGSLLYLANGTRPDINYAVNVVSRHQINPTQED